MKPLTIFSPQVYVEVVHGACNRRLLDAQKIATYFEVNGYKTVEMARKADIFFLITRESLNLMKRCCAQLTLTTDVIVGYPGETDEDIAQTVDLLCSSKFDSVHIFLYNDVPTADSYVIHPKVPRNIAIQRVSKIKKELSDAGIDSLVMV